MKWLIITLILASLLVSGIVGCEQEQESICNAPYIQVGTECCLDENDNGICDRDEGKTCTTQMVPYVEEECTLRDYSYGISNRYVGIEDVGYEPDTQWVLRYSFDMINNENKLGTFNICANFYKDSGNVEECGLRGIGAGATEEYLFIQHLVDGDYDFFESQFSECIGKQGHGWSDCVSELRVEPPQLEECKEVIKYREEEVCE